MTNHPNRSKRPKWQPMETAPKDGTPVLAYDGDSMTTVYWFAGAGEPGWWDLVEAGSYADDGEWQPTHWMHLPPPPRLPQCGDGE